MAASQWLLQILLNLGMLTIGVVASLRGITLGHLAEIYDSSLTIMGLSVVATGIGGTIGCNTVGFVLERFPLHQHVIMSFLLLSCALGTVAMPLGQVVSMFCAANLVYGFGFAFSTVANALSIRMWRKSSLGAGPFVHTLFLFCLLGALIAPIICIPFLSNHSNASNSSEPMDHTGGHGFVAILFSVSGLIFLILALLILKTGKVINGSQGTANGEELDQHKDIRESEEERMPNSYLWKRRALVVIAAIFYIADYSVIMGISNFLLLALELGPLGLSSASSSVVISTFFFGEVIMTAINSILSKWLNPYQIMISCLALTFVGASLLWFSWSSSFMLVEVSFFILGLGSSPLYGNTLVWLDLFIPVEAKTTGFLQSSSALGMLIAGLIFGPYVENYPQIFVYYIFVFFLSLLLIFGSGELLGRSVRGQREDEIRRLDKNNDMNVETLTQH